MYVYHWFVPALLGVALPFVGLAVPTLGGVRWLLFSAVSILLAAASWHLMEQPILRFKRFFSYQKRTSAPTLAATQVQGAQ
ncbi:hypothetical protein AWN76_015705 [Rhodothermaceae bacterium RA]|nr:hypothetical protein AWN76_015705 [Rhodothermaceae bacterium RA]